MDYHSKTKGKEKMLISNGLEVTRQQAENIINQGGAVTVQGFGKTVEIHSSSPNSIIHHMTRSDNTMRFGVRAKDTLDTAGNNVL